jgi:hypothetical protein
VKKSIILHNKIHLSNIQDTFGPLVHDKSVLLGLHAHDIIDVKQYIQRALLDF